MIIPTQIRAARALVAWTQADLARSAGLSEVSIKNIESGATDPRVTTLLAIKAALVGAGVVFIPENGGGAGVRLFKDPLAGWKQCEVPFGAGGAIRQAFEQRFLVGRGNPEEALFSRLSEGMNAEIFLISPRSAGYSHLLPGTWTDAVNPSLSSWSLEIGVADARDRFGMPRSHT